MKPKPLNAYWVSELAPENEKRPNSETLKAANALMMNSTRVPTLDAAVSDEKAREIEQYRQKKSADNSVIYPFWRHKQQTAAMIAEMDYFLTCSGVRA